MRVAISSRRHSGIVPLRTANVRFCPQYDAPELKTVSPGIVMSSPACEVATPACCACQSYTTLVGGKSVIPYKTYTHHEALEAKLSFQDIIQEM
jgi:hypothetical protein